MWLLPIGWGGMVDILMVWVASLVMEESIKEEGTKEIGFEESENQSSYVLIKKLIKRKIGIQLVRYLVSQI